ncbi:hypothetical protein [Vibrio owensii]|uniref:hypothetical protein n=1 Tax=Vibrio owensii TaxID=696485 RepID=UPI000597E840|nr:hypothetical protein [Vibrio owensii]
MNTFITNFHHFNNTITCYSLEQCKALYRDLKPYLEEDEPHWKVKALYRLALSRAKMMYRRGRDEAKRAERDRQKSEQPTPEPIITKTSTSTHQTASQFARTVAAMS